MAQIVVTHPIGPIFDLQSNELTPKCAQVMRGIFRYAGCTPTPLRATETSPAALPTPTPLRATETSPASLPTTLHSQVLRP